MEATDALDEIAFLLERNLASPYKTKAFRGALSAIEAFTADEIEAGVDDGSLKRRKGIGSTTWTVIEQAVAGEVPDYLADLRERIGGPVTKAGTKLRAKLKGDLHSHSYWSDGTTDLATMARTAERIGHDYLVASDHSPSLRIANGLSTERLEQQLDELATLNEGFDDFRMLSGIEVDILETGDLDQSAEMLDRLDVVVASVHSKLRTPSREMTTRMLAGIRHPRTNVLGHCTGRLVQGSRGTRPQSTFDAKAVFAACAENDVAVEINSRPERQDPPDDLLALALDAGCLFSIDSDAHAPGQLGLLDLGAARAEALGIPADRIITTWPVDKLLEWCR
ncbi:PHP domain-containing protein [Mycetocola zhadangensis]|uniref:PHP domain-containing protein n=1 Tax=Mycetocola zhadangensis TaxID=1164595 RepID=A0A3L7J0Y1_9MICO|nr:PHP domain-containing protein [Mycetocola zhadangensis]RLQ84166.1 PHP domain-containing protein [Mycetocola zhadangensis]GGE95517.1 PHP domain-containing protein [Mycetocola zhadangensis]